MGNEPIDLLIVDDSAAIRKILQRVLQQIEIPLGNVFEASDGKQALDVLNQHPVSLVLSDINMPNMDGIELLRILRSSVQWQDLPVIMITTEGSQAKVAEAAKLGATSYVRKPFTADQLRYKLAAVLSA
jgi:two-component system, chemotaxis family, chemotaxis protein CheY